MARTAQSTIRQRQRFGDDYSPASSSRRPTLPMITQPMPAMTPARPKTLSSYQPSAWDKMKFRVEHSVLNRKVFATERSRLIGASVGGIFAGAILHALISGKNDE